MSDTTDDMEDGLARMGARFVLGPLDDEHGDWTSEKDMPKNIFHIDEDSLDQENIAQCRDLGEYGERKAEAKHKKASYERRLNLLEAKLKLRMRKRPSKYDLPAKPPMELIKAAILVNPKYIRLQRKLADFQHEYDLLVAAVDGLHEKGKRIETLLELHKTNYYTDPERRHHDQSYRESEQLAARSSLKRRKRR